MKSERRGRIILKKKKTRGSACIPAEQTGGRDCLINTGFDGGSQRCRVRGQRSPLSVNRGAEQQ